MCDIGTVQCDNETIKCKKKNKETTECDKSIVTCDIGTAQFENDIIKCEKKKIWVQLNVAKVWSNTQMWC